MQPRERLLKYGPDKLTNSELLALLLRTGIKGKKVPVLARSVMKSITFEGFVTISIDELLCIEGIGIGKASAIIASIELGKRLFAHKKISIILTPKEVWERMEDLRDQKKEHFVIFFLDVRNQVIKREVISIGSLNASIVHPREVFEPAVRLSSAHIILAHTHPSDDTTPSPEDIVVTKRLVEAGKILGIEILDHVIVSTNLFLSMKQRGIL